jgi:hypothetical protein
VAPIKHDIVLGITWLHDIYPTIDWRSECLKFPNFPVPALEQAVRHSVILDYPELARKLNYCELLPGKACNRIMK